MDRLQYLLLMGACAALTLPLEFLFGARVWRRPRRFGRALVLPFVAFFCWDVVAIGSDHWSFSRAYTTGWQVVLGVPVEEVAFFVVVPACALLTYATVVRALGR
jgi:lycopene beta-cyclase